MWIQYHIWNLFTSLFAAFIQINDIWGKKRKFQQFLAVWKTGLPVQPQSCQSPHCWSPQSGWKNVLPYCVLFLRLYLGRALSSHNSILVGSVFDFFKVFQSPNVEPAQARLVGRSRGFQFCGLLMGRWSSWQHVNRPVYLSLESQACCVRAKRESPRSGVVTQPEAGPPWRREDALQVHTVDSLFYPLQRDIA